MIRTGGVTDGVADGDGRGLPAAERAISAPTLPTAGGSFLIVGKYFA
jgi:hypothetical protein